MVEVEFVDTVAEVLAPDARTLFVVGAAATLKAVGAEIGLPAEGPSGPMATHVVIARESACRGPGGALVSTMLKRKLFSVTSPI